jgi:hypothetical protein
LDFESGYQACNSIPPALPHGVLLIYDLFDDAVSGSNYVAGVAN